MPNFLFEHAWPGMVLWALLYISDYALTIMCARLYERQKTIVFEGSYEITPFFQRDINSLRVVSPRFVFILLLILGLLGSLWILIKSSLYLTIELWQFALGALIGAQLTVLMRHLRNLFIFRSLKDTDLIRGRIEYNRPLLLRASSWELLVFSGFYLVLFAFTGSWFILGGAAACFSLGLKHRGLTAKLHTNVGRAPQFPQQT